MKPKSDPTLARVDRLLRARPVIQRRIDPKPDPEQRLILAEQSRLYAWKWDEIRRAMSRVRALLPTASKADRTMWTVFEHLLAGMDPPTIADSMGLSLRTVQRAIATIRRMSRFH